MWGMCLVVEVADCADCARSPIDCEGAQGGSSAHQRPGPAMFLGFRVYFAASNGLVQIVTNLKKWLRIDEIWWCCVNLKKTRMQSYLWKPLSSVKTKCQTLFVAGWKTRSRSYCSIGKLCGVCHSLACKQSVCGACWISRFEGYVQFQHQEKNDK